MAHSSQTIPPPAQSPKSDVSATVTPCAVCSSPLRGEPSVRLGKSQLRACESCGSWTYLPRPNSTEQAAIHDTEDYFDHPYFELRRHLSPAVLRRCRHVFARLAKAANIETLRGQRMLDIGCDTGAFLQAAAQEFGVVPVGIDAATRSIATAQQQGIEAYRTPIESAPEHLRDFPVITAIDLIEHVTDPAGFLREIRKRLRPDGVVYLETPNIRSMVYRIGRGLSHLAHGRPESLFERLFPPQHVQYFTLESMAALCRRAGFEIITIDTRALPWDDIAASPPVRAAMATLQMLDRSMGTTILICAVLRRPLE
ncbi:MAG TPA: class I SAM-dependent methyltransferase [Bryobacteraceae bacterium]|nr:class I SAM-dependent methyltransferase [Bryobacteraceae bacterium]